MLESKEYIKKNYQIFLAKYPCFKQHSKKYYVCHNDQKVHLVEVEMFYVVDSKAGQGCGFNQGARIIDDMYIIQSFSGFRFSPR